LGRPNNRGINKSVSHSQCSKFDDSGWWWCSGNSKFHIIIMLFFSEMSTEILQNFICALVTQRHVNDNFPPPEEKNATLFDYKPIVNHVKTVSAADTNW
jgi:hypothetical protein